MERELLEVAEGIDTATLRRLVRRADIALSPSERISRNVILASVLEPISDKDGCTTRHIDIKPSKSLEMFLAAGVNIGPAFSHLVDHVLSKGSFDGIYGFYYEAEALSKVKRRGGKINQGIVEYLIPIAAAQAAFDPEFKKDSGFILPLAKDVMAGTTETDVSSLISAKVLANKMSDFFRYPVSRHRVRTVLDYYDEELLLERSRGNAKGVTFNRQFLNGFEGARVAYDAMASSSSEKISDRAVEGYNAIFKRYSRTEMAHGTAADLIAVALYLHISYGREEIIG